MVACCEPCAAQYGSLLVLMFAIMYLARSQAANITLGSRLTQGNNISWVSSDQTFHLGFYQVQGSFNFSVGVLYNLLPVQTAVWTAGGQDVHVAAAASFELTTDGNLVLSDSKGSPSWNSSTNHLNVTEASMLDTGNFVLYNGSGNVVWQSFDSPTDTLVTNQRLEANQFLQSGLYVATMEAGGNLTLRWNNTEDSYWSSSTVPATTSRDSLYASLTTLNFSISTQQGASVATWISSDNYDGTGILLQRVTLDGDGNLRIYSWHSGGSNWSIGWQAVSDQCQVHNYCADSGFCTYDSSGPTCICAEQAGYEYEDADKPRLGCKRLAGAAGQNCSGNIVMVQLNNTMIFNYGGNLINAGDSVCRRTSLQGVGYFAATSLKDGSGQCLLMSNTTSVAFSGYQEPNILATSFLKYCGTTIPPSMPSDPSSTSSKSSLLKPIIVAILGTGMVFAVLQLAAWFCYCRKNSRFGRYSSHYALLEYASGAPIQFSYKELRSATQNFSDKLGEGGFGAVYKGSLPSLPNKTEVAVKQLEGIDQGERQFRMEVAIIGSTHHMNLVRLCGFCAEGKHRLLVYEYMKNSSLDRYLFTDDSRSMPNLDWPTRFNVLLGTARGITYLHQECRDCIVHCDIKPENILLDENFCAKISDFGLAKLTNVRDGAHNHHVSMLVRGTKGYLAPEWRSNVPITVKSDVFSFGVVVLEAISGKKGFDTLFTSESRQSFSEWGYHQYFELKQAHGVVDERMPQEDVDAEELDRALKVAFWCMQVQPSARPSMSKVIQMLEGTLPVEAPPLPKLFGNTAILQGLESERREEAPASSSVSSTPFYKIAGSLPVPHSLVYEHQTPLTSPLSPHHHSTPL